MSYVKGRGQPKNHVVFEGGWPKNNVCLQWGEGGRKIPDFLCWWFVEGPLSAVFRNDQKLKKVSHSYLDLLSLGSYVS